MFVFFFTACGASQSKRSRQQSWLREVHDGPGGRPPDGPMDFLFHSFKKIIIKRTCVLFVFCSNIAFLFLTQRTLNTENETWIRDSMICKIYYVNSKWVVVKRVTHSARISSLSENDRVGQPIDPYSIPSTNRSCHSSRSNSRHCWGPRARRFGARETASWATHKRYESSNSSSRGLELTNWLGLVLGCIEASKQGRPVLLDEKKKEKRPRYARATEVHPTWFFQHAKSSTTRII